MIRPFVLPEKVFVTGTDTDVGKTLVSAILTIGLGARYWKPVQTGLSDGTDSNWLKDKAGVLSENIIPETYQFDAPLSPHAAAELESRTIDPNAFCLPSGDGPLIVEGAGGLMVPVTSSCFMIDLIKSFELPVILVARSGLGTINHTLLSLMALRQYGINVFGVVMNGPPNLGNRAAIETFGEVNVIAEVPQLESVSARTLKQAFCQYFA